MSHAVLRLKRSLRTEQTGTDACRVGSAFVLEDGRKGSGARELRGQKPASTWPQLASSFLTEGEGMVTTRSYFSYHLFSVPNTLLEILTKYTAGRQITTGGLDEMSPIVLDI